MKVDRILFPGDFKRATPATLTFKMSRGRISHILLVVQGTTFRKKDKLTLKLRHAYGSTTVIDRLPLSDLVQVSDMKYGVPSYGSVFPSDYSYNGQTFENDNTAANILYGRNAILLPIGNIFLDDAKAELEGLIEMSNGGDNLNQACHVRAASVDYSTAPAHVLQWDKTEDLEAKHELVRELYLITKDNESLYPSLADIGDDNRHNLLTPLDINVQYDANGVTYNGDLFILGALTSLIGELANPSGSMVRIFQDNGAVPSSMWLEVSGDDAKKVYVLACKEQLLPGLTLRSQHELLGEAQRKIEALQVNNPEQAKAYIQTGVTSSPAVLQAVKEQMPAVVATAS